MTGIEFAPDRDSYGRTYGDFHARRDPLSGPGWYVFGIARNVSAQVVRLSARPDVAPRRNPRLNVKVRRGWHTKAEAEAIAAYLNVHNRKGF